MIWWLATVLIGCFAIVRGVVDLREKRHVGRALGVACGMLLAVNAPMPTRAGLVELPPPARPAP